MSTGKPSPSMSGTQFSKQGNQLFKAIKEGRLDEVNRILDARPRIPIDWKGYEDRTPLIQATWYNNEDMVKLFITKRANLEASDENGRTALHTASKWGKKSIAQLLLEKGANVDARNKTGATPLIEATEHPPLMDLLLTYKSKVHAKDKRGNTALHEAVWNCQFESVLMLLRRGANRKALNNKRETPKMRLELSRKSTKYDAKVAAEITKLLDQGNLQQNLFIDAIKKVNEKVDSIKGSLEMNMEKFNQSMENMFQLSDERATEASEKMQIELNEIKKLVKDMQSEVLKDTDEIKEGVTYVIKQTSDIFANTCQSDDFNHRVCNEIFQIISRSVGVYTGKWKVLCKILLENFPKDFINRTIDEIDAQYPSEAEKMHELLIRWRIYMSRHADIIEPLKNYLAVSGIHNAKDICEEIDNLLDKHRKKEKETEKGSLSTQGLLKLARDLRETDWLSLGINLDITYEELTKLDADNRGNSEKRNLAILEKWKKREPGFAKEKIGRLAVALQNIPRMDLAQSLELE